MRLSEALDQTLRLPDGRQLGWAEFGSSDGFPVFYCHAFPGSRLMGRVGHAAALRRGIRYIAPDRPGYGLSDPKPGRTILDWADDVAALADRLQLEKFAIVGVSGGGPYALGCTLRLSGRVAATGLLSSHAAFGFRSSFGRDTLFYGLGFALAGRFAPGLARPTFRRFARLADRTPQNLVPELSRGFGERDRREMARPEYTESMMDGSHEAYRNGVDGAIQEFALLSRPWGFRPDDVKDHVWIWHGEDDRNVPLRLARRQAAALPRCSARFIPERGHFLGAEIYDEVFTALLSEPPQ